MNTADRFSRMFEVEEQMGVLVELGWTVKQIVYDDEAGELFHVMITLTTDGQDEEEGVL